MEEEMKVSYIELLGKKYPLCFSLSASERLSDAFGGMDKMQEALSDTKDIGKLAKAVDTILTALMDAGNIYCKMANIETPEKLLCRPSDLIDMSDPAAISAIFSAISAGNEREVEVADSKNAETQGK